MNERARVWNERFSWLAPILMIIFLGIFGLWAKGLRSDIARDRKEDLQSRDLESRARNLELFYPSSSGLVLEERLRGMDMRLKAIEEYQKNILSELRGQERRFP